MKILITGSHLTPAIATIQQLIQKPKVKIVYVGRKTTMEGDPTRSIESEILPSLGVKYRTITTGRFRRNLDLLTFISLLKIPIGFIQAAVIISQEKPDVILSFGGYMAVPSVLVGWLFSIPIIIHEQTLIPGFANKLSSLFATKIALSFNKGLYPGKQTVLTGNPLREEILEPTSEIDKQYQDIFLRARQMKLPLIFVTGGNQGSHAINQAVEANLSELTRWALVIHQTGDSKFKDFERLSKLQNDRYLVKRWVGQEIGLILQRSSLVICRAGINTLLELAFFKKRALVIPIPNHLEQLENGKFFERLGLIKVLPEKSLNGSFIKELRRILKAGNFKINQDIVIPDAAKRLALETIILAQKR